MMGAPPVLCPDHLRRPSEWPGYNVPDGVPPGAGLHSKAQPLVADMAVGEMAYVMSFALYADPDGRLWVESRNICYRAFEIEGNEMAVVRTPDGVKVLSWDGYKISRQTPHEPVWVVDFRPDGPFTGDQDTLREEYEAWLGGRP